MLAGYFFQFSVAIAAVCLSAAAFLIYFGRRLRKNGRIAFGLILILVSLPCLLLGGICGVTAMSEYQALQRRKGVR